MAKNPEERIETLERRVTMYRILVTLMFLLLLVVQRQRIGNWVDGVEKWVDRVSGSGS